MKNFAVDSNMILKQAMAQIKFEVVATIEAGEAMENSFDEMTSGFGAEAKNQIQEKVNAVVEGHKESYNHLMDLSFQGDDELAVQALELNKTTLDLAVSYIQNSISEEKFIEGLDSFYKYDQGQLAYLLQQAPLLSLA